MLQYSLKEDYIHVRMHNTLKKKRLGGWRITFSLSLSLSLSFFLLHPIPPNTVKIVAWLGFR